MRRILLTCIAILALPCVVRLSAEGIGDTIPLQGVRGNTLVAGKTTAFRLYDADATIGAVARVDVTVLRPDGSQYKKTFTKSDVVEVPKGSTYPGSVVLLVPGKELPWVGNYKFDASVINGSGTVIVRHGISRLALQPTRDLIVAIDRVNANDVNPGSTAEIQAARDAIQRLATVWPIRDGISTPDGDRTAGLRYVINNNPKPYGCAGNPKESDCQLCPFYASYQNRPAGQDVMNAGVGFRFQDAGEDMGGIAPNFCPNQSVGWASVVANAPLAPGIGQETGHVFNLEPTNDPHFDSTVQKGHSKDTTLDTSDVVLGFDIQTNKPFRVPMYDAMHQAVCGCANEETAYNSWDWEFLRQQFVQFKSTGPSMPQSFFTENAPAVTGVGKSVYFLGRRSDGRIFYDRAVLGEAGIGWTEMEGDGVTNASPATAAVGSHVFVAIKGLDGKIYVNQADEGKSFGQWFPMNFQTDVAPALAAVGNRIFVIAKGLNSHVYFSQAVLGQAFSGWSELQGGGQTNQSPSAAAVGDHIFVAIHGLDGGIQMNQADVGHPFVGWSSMNLRSSAAPALTAVAHSIFVFAKGDDGRILLNQAELGHSFSGWFEVQGNGKTSHSPAAGVVGNHVFVLIRGLDGRIYTNQTDFGKAFGSWIG